MMPQQELMGQTSSRILWVFQFLCGWEMILDRIRHGEGHISV